MVKQQCVPILFVAVLLALVKNSCCLSAKLGNLAVLSSEGGGGSVDDLILVSEEKLLIECPFNLINSKGDVKFSWSLVVGGLSIAQPELIVVSGQNKGVLKAPIYAPSNSGAGFIRIKATASDDSGRVDIMEACIDVFTIPSIAF
mmetsp:Transcript_12823/g.15924  ORF Transcript_12823/g.15924 Transcript_12823/m.15924 type:complete len:145 (-) Transcript_12823:1031-1465(-)|eukprot:CAMPEP_0204846152 /NCGR_PEP_ID=MMETSP1347-20130617/1774_1 /ASSEMBLY_ACC=CAM_ASM_000690 /TAXON_ID=215587 /ORGANISM="Aplanochytrium stocchinoi, Strain GSBS06" /LENGTH=144 /DNA_ID=CAMNT_0051986601 /DNA_START=389 /DNA_END=823 /DNA_ORIENTATION=+